MILTKLAVYKTASVYRNFINSGNISKNKFYFRQYGEKLVFSRHGTSTVLQSVQSIFLLSVLQNILEFSMLLPFLLRQKQGDFREKFFTKGSSSCHTERRNFMMQGSKVDSNVCLHTNCYLLAWPAKHRQEADLPANMRDWRWLQDCGNCMAMEQSVASVRRLNIISYFINGISVG